MRVHALTTTIQAFLPEVFMPKLGCQLFRAKELLTGVLHAAESRNRRAHSETMGHTMPSEAEALDAMQQVGVVLAQCGCADEAAKMTKLLSRAQELVERAREPAQDGAAPPTETVSVSCNESATLVRRRALFDFENRLQATAGEVHFMKGNVSFGAKQDGTIVNNWDGERLKRIKDPKVKDMFRRIAASRRWLFHVTSHSSQLTDDLHAMGVVLRRVDGIKDGVHATDGSDHDATPSDWTWKDWDPPDGTATVSFATTLQVASQRVSIPKFREKCLVGRDTEIEKVAGATLAGDHSRVLMHGPPGVGKDVTAAEAVLRDDVKLNPKLTMQAWLQGSTDEMFRRQLVRLFATQRPNVARGSGDQAATLAKIKEWLAANPSCWLFVVEDANAESKSIWTCLPPGAGRVIYTSVEDLTVTDNKTASGTSARLSIAEAKAIELAPLSAEDSIKMWRKMNLFALNLPDVDLTEPENRPRGAVRRCQAGAHCACHPGRERQGQAAAVPFPPRRAAGE